MMEVPIPIMLAILGLGVILPIITAYVADLPNKNYVWWGLLLTPVCWIIVIVGFIKKHKANKKEEQTKEVKNG